jgi:hypothetical protein
MILGVEDSNECQFLINCSCCCFVSFLNRRTSCLYIIKIIKKYQLHLLDNNVK